MSQTLLQPAAQLMVQESAPVAIFFNRKIEAQSMKTSQKRYFKLPWITCVGAFQFLVLSLTAMLFYSGGNVSDLFCDGYTFGMNKFSDLGMTVAYSGKANMSFWFFNPSIFLFGLSLIPLGMAVSRHFESNINIKAKQNKIALNLIIIAAIGLAGVGLTPKDLAWAVAPHIITQSIGFLALMVWEIYVAKFIFRTHYPNLYAKALIVAVVVQIVYFGFLFNPNNVTGGSIYCLAQKIVVYTQTMNVLIQSIGSLKNMGEKEHILKERTMIPILSYKNIQSEASRAAYC
jgi:hypothetical membrane protein